MSWSTEEQVTTTPNVDDWVPSITALANEPGLPSGYSHRVVQTATPNHYLAVWVQGRDGSQDIYYQFFDRVP